MIILRCHDSSDTVNNFSIRCSKAAPHHAKLLVGCYFPYELHFAVGGMHWLVLFRLPTELTQKGYCLSRYSSARASRTFLCIKWGFSLALISTRWNNYPPIAPCRLSGLWMLHVVFSTMQINLWGFLSSMIFLLFPPPGRLTVLSLTNIITLCTVKTGITRSLEIDF